jgi:hypothetical protein
MRAWRGWRKSKEKIRHEYQITKITRSERIEKDGKSREAGAEVCRKR